MTWISTIPPEEAEGKLARIYKRIQGPDGHIDNILLSHSLRPNTLEAHMAIYKNVLHHSACTLEKWFREALGTYVSLLNNCTYCFEHHYQGMKKFLGDQGKAKRIRNAFEAGEPSAMFEGKELALLTYAYQLTLDPSSIAEADIEVLRAAGCDDGEILEANQVISYFAYANRTVLGLGTNTDGDILGLSPSDEQDNDSWAHQ